MGRETPSSHSRLMPRFENELHRLNFYRFCQLIEHLHRDNPPLGSTSHPGDDPVRLLPHPGMGFPASELKALEYGEGPPVVRTTFLGLYGVDAPMPGVYLDDIAQRSEGHEGLQGFLDIFNHRVLTQFYRIWRKYSYPATFEAGGKDETSQSLLGLIGLGIPGTGKQIATPISRFLALLGVMRQPGRTAEGIAALVRLLAPQTSVQVQPHSLRPVPVSEPRGLSEPGLLLDGNLPLGDEVMDVSSQLLINLQTDCADEARCWLPDGLLYQDFQVMLRVYLGWRYTARIRLTLNTSLLAPPRLGEASFWLGMIGVLGVEGETCPADIPATFTTELGSYTGMEPATPTQGNRRVVYHFT
ncbi:type VI secretion system baseplate subunit TssG [Pantoea phytobeneficialis]|uniref:Type VI secretion system baseplate subunit TssG n=1 Tax=Pantoea phytobeneficialis TaxID=2052056 RepID=A0AAP9KQP4_9GAMM|nr:type VI secretion system baseplate subunit TssG [Pantoea phytobeneficialis]MDO6410081.1 type VI secretion system baseplate subunit TssG [Pantoea phytobeneficialis]QGR08128.1 type VI secretion system baseplate subunit TssG [Pantoea phytobeneficialis]